MMAPKKRETDRHLPQRVYFKHGAYYFFAPATEHKKPHWIRLGKTEAEAYAKLAELKCEKRQSGTAFMILAERYRAEVIPAKAPRTQSDNLKELANLEKSFGKIDDLSSIRPIHVYQYLDSRSKAAKSRANREISLLSHVFSYAIRWGMMESNPCRDVKKNPEKPRQRYVTEAEYNAVYAIAPPVVQAAMEIAAITGMRQGDILALKRQDLTAEGVLIAQRKTGKKQLFEWTEALRKATNQALGLQSVNSFHLFALPNGRPYSSSGFQTAWQRIMNKAMELEVIAERFTFHDLRAKAGSESDDAQRLLGHQSPATTAKIYRRLPEKAKPNR